MFQQAGRKVLEGMRGMRERPSRAGGMAGRMRDARAAVDGLSRRMRDRTSAARPSRWAGSFGGARFRPGLAALAAAGAALALAGILLYLRKRRQVAAHYTMGEGDAAWEGGAAPAFGVAEAARDAETAPR